jgi:hypothetical protein
MHRTPFSTIESSGWQPQAKLGDGWPPKNTASQIAVVGCATRLHTRSAKGVRMKYFLLKPEVPGGFGENTVIDHTVKPFRVDKLHYEFQGWLGDDLLTSFPCIIATVDLVKQLNENRFSGYSIDDVEISTSYEFRQLYPDRVLPEFQWIKVHGTPGKDDFGLSGTRRLVVSETVLNILKTFKIEQCRIEEYPEQQTES